MIIRPFTSSDSAGKKSYRILGSKSVGKCPLGILRNITEDNVT
jgi:hypothetical protein